MEMNGIGFQVDTTATDTFNKDMGKDDFLKLLVTQMQHQDPLNPMDNTQFVAQLAQFTSLEELHNISGGMESLAMAQYSQSSSQAVNLIGKDILAVGDWIQHASGESDTLAFDLGADASDVTLQIKDENGDIVRSVELGNREEGRVDWTWDGLDDDGNPLEDGEYTYSLTAKNIDGDEVADQQYVRGRVTAINFTGGIPMLVIGDHELSLAEVVEVKEGEDA